jgi:hypothetical protein
MLTRRAFIARSAAASLCTRTVQALESTTPPTHTPRHRIKALLLRDETIVRQGQIGCGFPMTWVADDSQLVSVTDGASSSASGGTIFHSRMLSIAGDPPAPKIHDILSYPQMLTRFVRESDFASFWGAGCLALDGKVYQSLATSNHRWLKPDSSFWPGFHYVGAKLIYSEDNGATWRNQDGSSPVLWERWEDRSQQNMVFFNEEPNGAFSWLGFLQMGRNYELNRDGYVYVYSSNGGDDGTMNELVMFRVPKAKVLSRAAYEFFSGRRSDGSVTWTKDISARAVVHRFPKGWVNRDIVGTFPWAWGPSVTYNAPLGVYMLTSWGTGCNAEGGWFGKPSYLGFWISSDPWGPFTQVYENLAWTPGGDAGARAITPQIPPKWISADGKALWLVWSDYQYKDTAAGDYADRALIERVKHLRDDAEVARVSIEWSRKYMPFYSLNMQRVDVMT